MESTTPQSSIIKHVPSRARNIEQILEWINKHNVTNEMLIKVGLRMNGNLLFGSNQRCVAMLIVFKSLLDDINPNEELQTGPPLTRLQKSLKQAMDFLDFCRPLSVSMTNAYKLVRVEILKLNQASTDKAIASLRLDSTTNSTQTNVTQQQNDTINSTATSITTTSPEANKSTTVSSTSQLQDECDLYEEQKQQLKSFVDRFIDEEIWSAQRGICENISSNIRTNDVILVYGCSTIVQHVLLHSKSQNKRFRIIIVDSPPHFNGRRMLRFLNDNSIDATYTLMNSLSFVMRQATKVLIGANSMLANGYVMSHIGTSQVALMAKATNVPTLVCCETYKLSDKVYVDSFACNEVDGGHELGSALNLRYDLTPPEFVSMVINEKSTVPAESVAALLRFRAERTRSHTQQQAA